MSAVRVRSRRHPISKAAVISHNGWMTGCTVADVSVGGARVQVSGSASVPDQFELQTDLVGSARRCRVIWREDGEIGVEFIDWI